VAVAKAASVSPVAKAAPAPAAPARPVVPDEDEGGKWQLVALGALVVFIVGALLLLVMR
jgi:hypothetical protein